jgi:hypothetical protein
LGMGAVRSENARGRLQKRRISGRLDRGGTYRACCGASRLAEALTSACIIRCFT